MYIPRIHWVWALRNHGWTVVTSHLHTLETRISYVPIICFRLFFQHAISNIPDDLGSCLVEPYVTPSNCGGYRITLWPFVSAPHVQPVRLLVSARVYQPWYSIFLSQQTSISRAYQHQNQPAKLYEIPRIRYRSIHP